MNFQWIRSFCNDHLKKYGLFVLFVAGFANHSVLAWDIDDPMVSELRYTTLGNATWGQLRMQLDVPLSQATMIGTHNSFSWNNEGFVANQYLASPYSSDNADIILRQLSWGLQFIELDIHAEGPFEAGPEVGICHEKTWACTGEGSMSLRAALDRVKTFIEMGRDAEGNIIDEMFGNQVFMIYIEDQVVDEDAPSGKAELLHSKTARDIEEKIGKYVYKSGGCGAVPDLLTPRDLLAAGKQVVIWKDEGCTESVNSALSSIVYSSKGAISKDSEDETDLCDGFGCYNDIKPKQVALAHEERTETIDVFGTPIEIDYDFQNFITLDFLVPNHDEFKAGIWTWDWENNHPVLTSSPACAIQGQNTGQWHEGQKWKVEYCNNQYRFACQNKLNGEWAITTAEGKHAEGERLCREEFTSMYFHSTPVSARDNLALTRARKEQGANNSPVWLNVNGIWDNAMPSAKAHNLYTENADFERWRNGEPNNNTHACAAVGTEGALNSDARLWQKETCNNEYRHVCYNTYSKEFRLTVQPSAWHDGRALCKNFGQGSFENWEFFAPRNAEDNIKLGRWMTQSGYGQTVAWVNQLKYANQWIVGKDLYLTQSTSHGVDECVRGKPGQSSWKVVGCTGTDAYPVACRHQSLRQFAVSSGSYSNMSLELGEQVCQNIGKAWHFIAPQYPDESYSSGESREAWLGLSRENSYKPWQNLEVLPYQSWAAGQPDDSNGKQDCAVLHSADVGSSHNGRWFDRNCSEQYRFACANTATGAIELTNTAGTWDSGTAICANKNSSASDHWVFFAPGNGNVNNSLTTKMKAANVNHIWINVTDSVNEGEWRLGSYGFTNWYPSYPSVALNNTRDYAVMMPAANEETGRLWGDLASGQRYHYHACRYYPSEEPALPLNLDDYWKITTDAGSWHSGEARCQLFGPDYHFAVPLTLDQNVGLGWDAIRENQHNVWMALTDHEVEGAWRPVRQRFMNWATNEPNGGSSENCTIAYPSPTNGHGAQWIDFRCSDSQPFMCRDDETGEWQVTTSRGTHEEGEAVCNREFGQRWRYAVPENGSENALMTAALNNSSHPAVWLDLSDADKEGVWKTNEVYRNYFRWQSNDPRNHTGSEDCARLTNNTWSSNGVSWVATSCSDSRYFACKNTKTGQWKRSNTYGAWDLKAGEQACQNDHGSDWHFAKPTDDRDNLKASHAASHHSSWLNVTDQYAEGVWQTYGGYDNWHTDELENNSQRLQDNIHAFIAANQAIDSALWSSTDSAFDNYAYACQHEFDSKAWGVSQQRGEWSAVQGEVACQQLGGHYRFSVPSDEAENLALSVAIKADPEFQKNPTGVWLNFQSVVGSTVWTTDLSVISQFRNWANGIPANDPPLHEPYVPQSKWLQVNCTLIDSGIGRGAADNHPLSYGWKGNPCSHRWPLACKNTTTGEWKATNFDSLGVVGSRGGPFWCGSGWEHGTPETPEDNRALSEYMNNNGIPRLYINISDWKQEGDWRPFTDPLPREPNQQ